MTLKATAFFDNQEQIERFISRLQEFNITSRINHTTVDVVYEGADRATYLKLIEMFEDERRHDIRTIRR